MCKHSIQFNPSSFSRSSPTCECIHTDVQGMELAWMDTMYEKLWLHSATLMYWCQQRMDKNNTVLLHMSTSVCSCCEVNYETGATMAVKKTVSTTTEAKQCFYYEGKIMKQGWKQQCTQWCWTLTLKTKFHNNGDNGIENSSVHNNIATFSLWRQNSKKVVTRALKTAVSTTWHSHFEDKIMKHWWQQHWKQQCSQQTQFSHFWRQNYETPVTTRSAAHFNYEIMKHWWQQHSVSTPLPEEMKLGTTCASNNAHFQTCNYKTSMTTVTLSMQLWDNGDNGKLQVAIMRQFVTSMNSNNTLWRWNLMKHWLLWLNKFT